MLFLDRDGVINVNQEGSYIMSVDDLEIYEFAGPAIAKYQAGSGQPVAIISNQAGVGLDYMSKDDLMDINRALIVDFKAAGVNVERVVLIACTHRPNSRCGCRKPKPGLLYWARGYFGSGIRALEDFMIGDSWTDIVAGRRADCRTILVETGRGKDPVNAQKIKSHRIKDCLTAPNLAAAIDHVLASYEEVITDNVRLLTGRKGT